MNNDEFDIFTREIELDNFDSYTKRTVRVIDIAYTLPNILNESFFEILGSFMYLDINSSLRYNEFKGRFSEEFFDRLIDRIITSNSNEYDIRRNLFYLNIFYLILNITFQESNIRNSVMFRSLDKPQLKKWLEFKKSKEEEFDIKECNLFYREDIFKYFHEIVADNPDELSQILYAYIMHSKNNGRVIDACLRYVNDFIFNRLSFNIELYEISTFNVEYYFNNLKNIFIGYNSINFVNFIDRIILTNGKYITKELNNHSRIIFSKFLIEYNKNAYMTTLKLLRLNLTRGQFAEFLNKLKNEIKEDDYKDIVTYLMKDDLDN